METDFLSPKGMRELIQLMKRQLTMLKIFRWERIVAIYISRCSDFSSSKQLQLSSPGRCLPCTLFICFYDIRIYAPFRLTSSYPFMIYASCLQSLPANIPGRCFVYICTTHPASRPFLFENDKCPRSRSFLCCLK